MRKPWSVMVAFLALIAFGVVWWLWHHKWDLNSLLTRNLEGGGQSVQNGGALKFAGVYEVEGPGYNATLTIRKAGQGYHLEWRLPDSSVYYGNGVAVAGVLGAVCNRGKVSHLAAYKRDGDGITGLWAVVGGDKLYWEKTKEAVRLKRGSAAIAGTYKLKGTNPNTTTYTGTLTLKRTGSTYEVLWETGEPEVYGTGFVVDDVAVLGYRNKMGVGTAVYALKDAELEGLWLYSDFERLTSPSEIRTGTERAVKR